MAGVGTGVELALDSGESVSSVIGAARAGNEEEGCRGSTGVTVGGATGGFAEEGRATSSLSSVPNVNSARYYSTRWN